MTVEEYLATPWYKKAGYRIMRSPWILFTIGAMIVFGITHRFWKHNAGQRERSSVIWTDIALAAGIGWIVLEDRLGGISHRGTAHHADRLWRGRLALLRAA